LCNNNKTIQAKYYQGAPAPTPQPGEPPKPTGSVALELSDGRKMTLPQTISGSGIRYANSDESFVFFSKGEGALVLENNTDQTYIGCIALAPNPGDLPQTYANGTVGFSVRYPADYDLDASYKYQELGPGKDISGTKLIIPKSLSQGTNLSSYDTGVSVEVIPAVKDCNASLFLDQTIDSQNVTDNDTQYSVAETNGAGAGNFYEEKIWAVIGTNPCIAVRYFIHSMNIGNYPAGVVKEFDRTALLDQFDRIRKSLIIVQ
jgi:hypothetical protein